ncbi:translation elongation factor Ts [Vulgatibacter sp.]|uniref:translation elongation factor Ts n=1 Tax=Vulgatibacter sp. TaxID=1971226 RepID=UPI0035631BE4
MAEVTAAAVKELREKTGAGMMDCKKALGETGGDIEKAVDWLRQKGLSAAAKKAGRAATEGAVASYIHGNGKIGVLVEVNCETDFVARNDAFQDLVKDIAMHIAAAAPVVVRREELPADMLERELDVYRGQLKEQGKPEKIWDKILEGKKDKYYSDVCLLEQAFVKDPDKKVQDLVNEAVAKIGENITIRRFARFVLGEGLEKKSEDFAAEIAKTAGLA